MKIARFQHAGTVQLGLVDPDRGTIRPLAGAATGPDPMIALIENHHAGQAPSGSERDIPLADVRLLHPIERPSKNVICVGKNYREHAEEFSRSGFDSSVGRDQAAVPDAPIVFSKAPCSLTGARADIIVPAALAESVDYEGELGVVIGRRGRAIKAADAYRHVFGYAVINDVTVRDLQSRHKQWLLGKSLDTFCPMGPWIVTADELDPEDLELSCRVNGELRQHANTRDLIFDIPTIIETVSTSMTLEAGDIIATGTPAGVGVGFDPPKFLRHGDVVTVAISGIGEIANSLVVAPA